MDPAAWPLVLSDKCEANFVVLPFIAEFFSALSAVAIAAAGLLSLFSSRYSDDLLDIVSALTAMNGVFSVLAHSTLLRIFGRADTLSINLGLLLYTRCILHAVFPTMARRPVVRGILDLLIVTIILFAVSWTTGSVPTTVSERFDASIVAMVGCVPEATVAMLALAYGRATWHNGPVKRVCLRGQLFFAVGTVFWLVEETGGLSPWCPMFFSFHPLWHTLSGLGLLSITAFLKYHRGNFYGFRVELRGYWWCPYTVWLEPTDEPERHPVVRHTASQQQAARTGRRNTYLEAQIARPAKKRMAQLWRGQSFYKTDAPFRRMSRAFDFANGGKSRVSTTRDDEMGVPSYADGTPRPNKGPSEARGQPSTTTVDAHLTAKRDAATGKRVALAFGCIGDKQDCVEFLSTRRVAEIGTWVV